MKIAWLPLFLLAQQVSDPAARVGRGRIEGGWEYVWACYAIAWGAIILYTLSLWLRRPERNS